MATGRARPWNRSVSPDPLVFTISPLCPSPLPGHRRSAARRRLRVTSAGDGFWAFLAVTSARERRATVRTPTPGSSGRGLGNRRLARELSDQVLRAGVGLFLELSLQRGAPVR